MLFGALLIALLSLALLGQLRPGATVIGLRPASLAMIGCYVGGLHLIRRAAASPLWEAVATTETLPDIPHAHGSLDRRSLAWLWSRFVAVGMIVAAGGWLIALAAESLVISTGLSAVSSAPILMGAVNALPETVTAVAAVRRAPRRWPSPRSSAGTAWTRSTWWSATSRTGAARSTTSRGARSCSSRPARCS